jgi:hypothetical protein
MSVATGLPVGGMCCCHSSHAYREAVDGETSVA